MRQMVRKSMAALLVLSAAGFLVTAARGQHGSPFFNGTLRHCAGQWSRDKDSAAFIRDTVSGITAAAASAAEAPLAANRLACESLAAAAESIRSLSRYIRSQNPEVSRKSSLVQANAFWKYSLKYNVPLELIVAVANTESHFRPEARSPAGAAGVMQVMWKVHAGLLQANGIMKEEELHDPEMGIAAGSLLLSRYLKAYGDTKAALGRYYGGPPAIYWDRISRNLAKVHNAKLFAAF